MRQNRANKEGVNIRLPDGMRGRLQLQAIASRRSLTAQIVHYLDLALAHQETNGPAGTAIPPGLRSSNPSQEIENERAQA